MTELFVKYWTGNKIYHYDYVIIILKELSIVDCEASNKLLPRVFHFNLNSACSSIISEKVSELLKYKVVY